MKHIETITVGSGGAAPLSVTNIPQTYDDLLIVISARRSDTVVGVAIAAPTGASWSAIYLTGNGSSASSSTESFLRCASTNTNDTPNTFGNSEVLISDYTNTGPKAFSVTGVSENNGTLSSQEIAAGLLTNAGSINSLDIFNNIVENSTVSLYGITAGGDETVTTS